jgi:predicted phosphodiesterase
LGEIGGAHVSYYYSFEECFFFGGGDMKAVPSEAAPASYPILSRSVKMTMMQTFETRRVCLKELQNLFR